MISVIPSAPPTIGILSGSSRRGSCYMALARVAERMVEEAGDRANLIDLTAYPRPLYDFALQARANSAAAAMGLRALFTAADGFLIASPEHDMATSILLKHAIDRVSRATVTESGKVPFQNRPAALCAALVGPLGGRRGLIGLRMILKGLDVHVLPGVVGIGGAASAFDPGGAPVSNTQAAAMGALVAKLVQTAQALRQIRTGQP